MCWTLQANNICLTFIWPLTQGHHGRPQKNSFTLTGRERSVWASRHQLHVNLLKFMICWLFCGRKLREWHPSSVSRWQIYPFHHMELLIALSAATTQMGPATEILSLPKDAGDVEWTKLSKIHHNGWTTTQTASWRTTARPLCLHPGIS